MKNIFKNKKGLSFGDLPNVALTGVLITVFFAVGLVILASLQSNSTVGGSATANAAVADGITALSEIPSNWLLLIFVIIAAAVVIGIVVSSLAGGKMGGR